MGAIAGDGALVRMGNGGAAPRWRWKKGREMGRIRAELRPLALALGGRRHPESSREREGQEDGVEGSTAASMASSLGRTGS